MREEGEIWFQSISTGVTKTAPPVYWVTHHLPSSDQCSLDPAATVRRIGYTITHFTQGKIEVGETDDKTVTFEFKANPPKRGTQVTSITVTMFHVKLY